MKNKELQEFLKRWPDDVPVKLLPKTSGDSENIIDLTEENIMQTTDKAWVDSNAPEDEWDTEDGKIVYDGSPYLLFNPIIV
jgi:hypothetical protein